MTTAEQVVEILEKGLERAERLRGGKVSNLAEFGRFNPDEVDHPQAYGYLRGAVEAALAVLGAHVDSEAYEAEQALRDDDRAKLGWR